MVAQRQSLLADLLGFQPLHDIIHMVADGAYVAGCALGGVQPDTALAAGKLHRLILISHGVDGLAADGALGSGTLTLIKDHIVAAVGADPAGQLVRADIDGVAAGAVDLLSGKEAGLGFHVFPTVGTFHYKFRHIDIPLYALCIVYSPVYCLDALVAIRFLEIAAFSFKKTASCFIIIAEIKFIIFLFYFDVLAVG